MPLLPCWRLVVVSWGLVHGSACFFTNALINLGFNDSINSIIAVGYLSLHAWFPIARKWILPYLYMYELIGWPGSCLRSLSSSLALFMVDIKEKSCLNLEMTSLLVQEVFIMESVSLMAPVDFFINSFHRFLSVILQACSTASNQPSNLEGSSPSYTSIPANRASSSLAWLEHVISLYASIWDCCPTKIKSNEWDWFLPVGWLIYQQHHWPLYC